MLYLYSKMIHFDVMDFTESRFKEVIGLFDAQYTGWPRKNVTPIRSLIQRNQTLNQINLIIN